MAWHAIFETHHIPHCVSLKAILLLEVKKYAFYLFLGKWVITFGSMRVGLTASGILKCAKVAEIHHRAPIVEKLCVRTQVLAIDVMVQVSVWLSCNHESRVRFKCEGDKGKDEPHRSGWSRAFSSVALLCKP
jgi:hypothetical protein